MKKYIGFNNIKIISPYEILKITELEINGEMNGHVRLKYKAAVPSEKRDTYLEDSKYNNSIKVVQYDGSKEVRTLFSGQPVNIGVECDKSMCYIYVEAISYSYDMDIAVRKRSFQNEMFTYDDMIKTVLGNYNKSGCLNTFAFDTAMKELAVQYKETDWSFLKRMASRFNTVIVPEGRQEGAKFWFGLPQGENIDLNKENYVISKTFNPYRVTKENYASDVYELNYTEFEIESGEYMYLGDNAVINGINMKVYGFQYIMEDGILKMRYLLKPAGGIRQNLIHNENIQGISLEGTVLDTKVDMIKILLDIDKNNPDCGSRWFKYANRYTYGENSGLYFMPEKGHFARLYFPTDIEADAYGFGCVRKDGNDNIKTQNPNIKLLGTQNYKEILCDEDKIKITARDNKEGNIYLEMNGDGINVISSGDINFNCADDIYITGKKISINSDDSILLTDGWGKILLDGGVTIENDMIEKFLSGGEDPFEAKIKNSAFNGGYEERLGLGTYFNDLGTTECTDDPIDIATGNFYINQLDIIVNGAESFGFTRFYNALDSYKGVMGYGWHHCFETKLIISDKKITVVFGDGRVEEFTVFSDGKILSQYGNREIKKEENYYVLKAYDKTVYIFNSDGVLISLKNKNNSGIKLIYENNLLVRAESRSGYIKLYYMNGLIRKAEDMCGRYVEYKYNKECLARVRNINGGYTEYKYDSDGQITKVINPNGIVQAENVYDNNGRVISQVINESGRIFIDYDDENRTTAITEKDSSVTVYKRNEYNYITEIEYSNGTEKKEFNTIGDIILYTDKNGNEYSYRHGEEFVTINPLGEESKIVYDEKGNTSEEINPDGSSRKYEYDEKGNVSEETDELGNRTEFIYDEKNNLTAIKYSDGVTMSFKYDKKGNPVSLIDGEGNESIFEYDMANRRKASVNPMGGRTDFKYNDIDKVTEIKYPDGKTKSNVYDLCGQLIEETERNGVKTKYIYGKHGKLTKKICHNREITEYLYDSMWNVWKEINPDGSEKIYKYNEHNLLCAEIDEEGGRKQYWHDGNGNVIREKNEEGNETFYEYDALDRIVKITDANGNETKKEYRFDGKVTKITYADGSGIIYEYDKKGQLIKAVNQEGAETKYEYNARGVKTKEIDCYGNETVYELDKNDRVIRVIYPDMAEEKISYDQNGNIISFIDKGGAETKYEYDCMDRISAVTDALGGRKEFYYTSMGKISAAVNELGDKTEYKYDYKGNLIKVIDENGNSVKYRYDVMNRLTVVIRDGEIDGDIKEIETVYKYNKKGLVTEEINALGKVTFYRYDRCGNLIEKEDRDGYITQYKYDSVNNLICIDYGDDKEVKYEYDSLNRIISMKDWLGETSYGLDLLGRIKRVKDFRGQVTGYKYGLKGETTEITYPDGNTVKYDYDINGRIKNVVSNDETAKYTYNSVGAVSELKYGNGLKTAYEYDSLNRLTRLAGFDKKGRIIDERKIKYDAAGRKIMTDIITSDRINETGKQYPESGVRYFTYDKKGQLTKVKYENGDSEEYDYDGFGNRTLSRITDFNGLRTESYSYDVLNRLIGIKENKDEKVLEYDSRGNLIKVRKGDEILESYIYDKTNRLIRAENSDKTVASFMYDGNGRRVRKENLYGVSEYVPDYTDEYNRVLFVSRKNGNENLIYGNGLIKSENCGESFCHFENEMTSVMRIMDSNGKTKKILQYSPFGEVYEFGKRGDIERTSLSFTGYECEENLNLMYAQARYYLPKIGRFAEEDSNKGNGYLPESLNYYMYCYNNPLSYVDLNGKEGRLIEDVDKRIANEQSLKDAMKQYNIKAKPEWNSNEKRATLIFEQNSIKRELIFRKDLKYVYEIREGNKDNIIYDLSYYIYLKETEPNKVEMILQKDDLEYILSCKPKNDYSRSTPIHVEYKVNNPNNIKPNEEGDVTKLYFKQKGDPIIYVDNPEGIGEHIFDNEELRSMYYYECDLERGKNYTVEYYAIGADDNVDGGRVFIALYPYNDNTTITVQNMAYGDTNKYLYLIGGGGSYIFESKDKYDSDGEYMHKLKSLVAAETQLDFFKNIKHKEVVKKEEVLCMVCNVLKEQMNNGNILAPDAKCNLINGKVKFSISSKMKLRICFLKPDDAEELGLSKFRDYKKITSNSLNNKIIKFKYGNEYLEANKYKEPTQTTAYMQYDTRSTIVYVDTNKPTKFCLSETADNNKFDKGKMYNDINSEYESLGKDSRGIEKEGRKIHLGNYSIIYEVQLLGNNLKNKKLIVKPNFIDTASILLYFNGNWHGYFFDKKNVYDDIKSAYVTKETKKDYIEISVPSDGFFKYLLPGANNGLTFFTVCNK